MTDRREAGLDLQELDEASHRLPQWLSQRALFWAPESLPRAELKLFTTRLVTIVAAGTVHLVAALLFAWWSQPVPALINVASVVWFIFGGWITRRGRHRVGILLAFTEVMVHVPLMTVLCGLEAGYLAYDVAMGIVVLVLFPASERSLRYLLIALTAAQGVATVWAARMGPRIALTEVELLGYLNVGGTVVALFFIMGSVAAASDRAEARLERERRRSEQLLLNILPFPIAERLKRNPGTIADAFQSVTVLFADVVGFTALASRVESTEVVEILNAVFSEFDHLADKHGLEKIKTIGDGYMVVGGLPQVCDGHADRAAQMALDMHEAVAAYAKRTGYDLEIRVGVHTGPVVAGVIGVNKFAYDIWGDTVNTASRMESQGAAGRTQLSDRTKALLGDGYVFEERGAIEVKGKGQMHTWYLVSRR